MKKEFFAIALVVILVLALCMALCGCSHGNTDNGRFNVEHPNNAWGLPVILVDRETGCQYLFYKSGYGGGMTLLVDKDGKPMLADVKE